MSKKLPTMTFTKRVASVLDTYTYSIHVTNYGEKKSEFVFYTPSESYAKVKQEIILKKSPEAIVTLTSGVIRFVMDPSD